MTTRSVSLSMIQRDAIGGIIGNLNANASTDDDGATITFGLGYLSGIDVADPADISVTVNQPAVIIPVSSVSLIVDEVNEIQTLTVVPLTE